VENIMNQAFSVDKVSATFLSTTDDVLMNAARYQARVLESRVGSALEGTPMQQNLINFSLILAHVTQTTGLPFYVPDPLAHPETIGQVWDTYIAGDATVWAQMLRAINAPLMTADQIHDKLLQATEEMHALSAHSASPFKRKVTGKR